MQIKLPDCPDCDRPLNKMTQIDFLGMRFGHCAKCFKMFRLAKVLGRKPGKEDQYELHEV